MLAREPSRIDSRWRDSLCDTKPAYEHGFVTRSKRISKPNIRLVVRSTAFAPTVPMLHAPRMENRCSVCPAGNLPDPSRLLLWPNRLVVKLLARTGGQVYPDTHGWI